MKFFVWLNEKQQGPFDDETIQKMVLEGQITHETLLCLEGGDLDWTPAKELFPPDLVSAHIALLQQFLRLNHSQSKKSQMHHTWMMERGW